MATKKQRTRTSTSKASESLIDSAARTAGAIAGEFANVILGGESAGAATAPRRATTTRKTARRRPTITKKTKKSVNRAAKAVRKSVRATASKAKKATSRTRKSVSARSRTRAK